MTTVSKLNTTTLALAQTVARCLLCSYCPPSLYFGAPSLAHASVPAPSSKNRPCSNGHVIARRGQLRTRLNSRTVSTLLFYSLLSYPFLIFSSSLTLSESLSGLLPSSARLRAHPYSSYGPVARAYTSLINRYRLLRRPRPLASSCRYEIQPLAGQSVIRLFGSSLSTLISIWFFSFVVITRMSASLAQCLGRGGGGEGGGGRVSVLLLPRIVFGHASITWSEI